MWNKATESKTATEEYLKAVIIGDGLGVVDPTSDEIKRVMEWDPTKKTVEVLITYLSDIVSRRALIGVSTTKGASMYKID
jgi:alkaline phosphatase